MDVYMKKEWNNTIERDMSEQARLPAEAAAFVSYGAS